MVRIDALPRDAAGKVALLALGFSYESRLAVEAWVAKFRNATAGRPDVVYYQLPMIGGLGRLAKPFIQRGMRRDTPRDEQRRVITVFGTGDWPDRVGLEDEAAAYLILIDRTGRVQWVAAEPIVNQSRFDELMARVEAIAR